MKNQPQTFPANVHESALDDIETTLSIHNNPSCFNHQLLSSDTITIIASFLPISDWFSMSAVNECWFQAMHHGMNHEWKRIYYKEWKLDRIIAHHDHLKLYDENDLKMEKGKFNPGKGEEEEKHDEEDNDHDDDLRGDEEGTVDWMRVIQYYLNKLPIKTETVERGECLNFCEERNKRMEWESPIIQNGKGIVEGENSFSIFQFSFHVLNRMKESIENFKNMDESLEDLQLELFKQYRVCLFMEYLSLGFRPSVVSDVVNIWEGIYDNEPILTLPLVSFLFILHQDNPIEIMEEFIQEEYGEISNWIYVSLSQCPQDRLGFSLILKELDLTNFSYDWNGKLPWYHQTDINEKNFPLYLGVSQHLADYETSYYMDDYDASPCRVYHLSISCELLATHHVKLYREEKIMNY